MTNKRGFSLIEIVCAISIFMLIGMITLTGINYYNNQILATETKKLYTKIALMQSKSIGSNLDTSGSKFYFNIASNSYFDGITMEYLDPNIKFGYLNNSFGPPANPESVIKNSCTFKGNAINFGSNGIMSAGTIYMVDKKENYMYAITIGVAKKSYIRIYKYTKPKWVTIN